MQDTSGPYNQYFCYGDGTPCIYMNGTTATSRGYSYAFVPCHTTTFTQTLHVQDYYGAISNQYSRATEGGSQPC